MGVLMPTLLISLTWMRCSSSPTLQFFNFPSNGELMSHPFGSVEQASEPHINGLPESWNRRQVRNTTRGRSEIDPISTSTEEESGRKFVQPRQVPLSPNADTFPKIFKVDDFIIISNPRPVNLPTCIPPTRPPFVDDNSVENRLGNEDGTSSEPSRCVWSIIACCSPGSRNIRYACFELLGCPGAFWDVNPCDDKVVMAAATVALNFYSQRTNSTLSGAPYPPSL